MDALSLIPQVRKHYVEQFRTFIRDQMTRCCVGGPEVKFEIPDNEALFGKLYCVDFVRNDNGCEAVESQPGHILIFDAIECAVGDAGLSIERLRWDDAVFEHDGTPSVDALSKWFRHWLDPEDERINPDAELCGIIHSMVVEPDRIAIDFGTAGPDAFWDLIELIVDAGARHITVTSEVDPT